MTMKSVMMLEREEAMKRLSMMKRLSNIWEIGLYFRCDKKLFEGHKCKAKAKEN